MTSYSPERAAQHLALFGQDPKAVCLVRLAWTTWHLGRFDEAEVLVEEGLAYADQLQHAYTEAYVHVSRRGRPPMPHTPIDPPRSWTASPPSGATRGWRQGESGAAPRLRRRPRPAGRDRSRSSSLGPRSSTETPFVALAGSRKPWRRSVRPGRRSWSRWPSCSWPVRAAVSAKTRRRCGTHGDALAIAEREMQIHEAEASRLYGQLLARCGGEPHEIEAALRRAVTVAARQGSVVTELRARTSLARWTDGADPQSHDPELEALRRRFPGAAALVDGRRRR